VKITVEQDDGKVAVYQNVTDALVVYRSCTPVKPREGAVAFMPETHSASWGNNLRELVKETSQALDELRVILRERQRGNPSQ